MSLRPTIFSSRSTSRIFTPAWALSCSLAAGHELEAMVGGAPAAVVDDEPEAGAPPAAADGQPRVVTLQKRPAGTRPTAEEQIPFGDTGTFGKF